MRIFFLGGNFDLSGGTERVTSVVANGLLRFGHDVTILSTQGGLSPFYNFDTRIRVRTLFPVAGRNIARAPQLIYRLRKVLVREGADVLVVVESMLALFSVPALAGLAIKHVCWEHFNFKIDLGRYGRRLARRLAGRYCDVVITLTEADREFWIQGANPRARVITINNPATFPVQYSHQPSQESRVVLSVGRLVAQKGYDLLLMAWRGVVAKEPEWRLRIVGDGQDKDALVALSVHLQVKDSVDFVGVTSDIQDHYRESAIYCLSSRFEGFGLVLTEAASFGVPIVSFDCDAGPSEILRGTGSILVPVGDVAALCEALLALIRNPTERYRISELLRKRAEEFQPEKLMEKWQALLVEIC